MFNLLGDPRLPVFFHPEFGISLRAAKINNRSVRFGDFLLFSKVREKTGLFLKEDHRPPPTAPRWATGSLRTRVPGTWHSRPRTGKRLLQNKTWFHFPTPGPGNPEAGRTWPGVEDLGMIREEEGGSEDLASTLALGPTHTPPK